ncbi:hypothetical protein M8J77_005412 [Diaphorina citri]|nr:hypothetical protein M8J77_005412 [Diaphorina citri]
MPEGQDLSNNLEANSIEAIQLDPEPAIEKNVPENEPCDTNTIEPTLSKRAMKRKLKHEKWLKWKPIKRAKEREKLKQKKQYAREHNIPLGPSRKALKLVKMENSPNKLRVCIDFSFDHLMTQKDICKCVKQFNWCYSLNRRAQHPLQFFVSSFKDKCKQEIARYNGYEHWDVHIHEQAYLDLFKKEDLVYLTSDSDNIIEELDQSKVYIIGGLVDHNQHKLLTLNKAREENIAHGKLPIDTYLNMKTRQVLAVNHVFQILLAISSDKKSWKDALLETLPERKNAAAKNTGSEDAESCGEEEFEIKTGGEKSGNERCEAESCDRSEHEKKVQDSTCEKKLLECDNKT